MNLWGFTPGILKELEENFSDFLVKNKDNILKAEYFLPEAVGRLISENRAKVRVLRSKERWYGITYAEDKPVVKKAILDRIRQGLYPENLWKKG